MHITLSFVIIFSLLQLSAAGQKLGDTIHPGVFDTSNIEIGSKKSFPFCGKIYAVPRKGCDDDMPPNCCYYNAQLIPGSNRIDLRYISCYNGSSLMWNYYGSEKDAKGEIENKSSQLKKQMKSFVQMEIKCIVMEREADGYLIEAETYQGHKTYYLWAAGTYGGYSFSLEYDSQTKISNEVIQPFIREIIRLL